MLSEVMCALWTCPYKPLCMAQHVFLTHTEWERISEKGDKNADNLPTMNLKVFSISAKFCVEILLADPEETGAFNRLRIRL